MVGMHRNIKIFLPCSRLIRVTLCPRLKSEGSFLLVIVRATYCKTLLGNEVVKAYGGAPSIPEPLFEGLMSMLRKFGVNVYARSGCSRILF